MLSSSKVTSEVVNEIATACELCPEEIEDIYDCTPLQVRMISPNRAETFHFIVSFGPTAEIERFIDALRRVVKLNQALRTRIVTCSLGTVQVAVSEEHVTARYTGELDACLKRERSGLKLGRTLFRSMFLARTFVATIHHAIMDYWSLTTLLSVDVPKVYLAQTPPIARPPFKSFVEHIQSIDGHAARLFWANRFDGRPATFPQVASVAPPNVVQGSPYQIELGRSSDEAFAPQMPFFIEAAWAITSSIYSGNEKVAYGYVFSGRSLPLEGELERTLGPTIVEVPVQANIRPTLSVDRLVRARALSVRQLQSSFALQYPLEDIANANSATKTAAGFRTLLNIRPDFRPILPNSGSRNDISYDEMQWFGGKYPLQLICSIMDDCVWVEPRYDSAVLTSRWLERVLAQFGHLLQIITQAPSDARLADLPLLGSRERETLLSWNANLAESRNQDGNPPMQPGWRYSLPIPGHVSSCFWIVDPQNIHELLPIGATGEVILECQSRTTATSFAGSSSLSLISRTPRWSIRTGTAFFRTGRLAKYDDGGNILFVGQKSNRIRVMDLIIQLEDVEEVLAASGAVCGVAVLTRIIAGRTQLVAVLCIPETELAYDAVLQMLPDTWTCVARQYVSRIREHASAHLVPESVPSIWYVVQQLPRSEHGSIDRKAVRDWLKSQELSKAFAWT